MAKRLIIAVLFAVLTLGGGGPPLLHAHAWASPGSAHLHTSAASTAAATQDDDRDSSHHGNADRGCLHAHAHCCCAVALLPTPTLSPPGAHHALLHFERKAAVPYGQRIGPPLRPPRDLG